MRNLSLGKKRAVALVLAGGAVVLAPTVPVAGASPQVMAWKIVHWGGMTLREPSWMTAEEVTPDSYLASGISGAKLDLMIWVVKDPNHSAWQNVQYLAARAAAKLRPKEEWPGGAGYLLRLGQERFLLVPNPRGKFSLVVSVSAPPGYQWLVNDILAGWRIPGLANPAAGQVKPDVLKTFVRKIGHLTRTVHWVSVASRGVHARVPVTWRQVLHPSAGVVAEWLSGGLSMVDGVEFERMSAGRAHDALFWGWNPANRLYAWPRQRGWLEVAPSQNLTGLTEVTEVVPESNQSDLVASVSVRAADLATGMKVLEAWNDHGVNPFVSAAHPVMPTKLSPAAVKKLTNS